MIRPTFTILEAQQMETDDNYETCEMTFATLRIYLPEDIVPEEVTKLLRLQPDNVLREGEVRPSGRVQRITGWFLGSEGRVDSRDSRRHIHWLLDQLELCKSALKELSARGARLDIDGIPCKVTAARRMTW